MLESRFYLVDNFFVFYPFLCIHKVTNAFKLCVAKTKCSHAQIIFDKAAGRMIPWETYSS